MKRLATLFILTILVTTAGFAKPKHKDLSGNIAIKGELTKEYQQSPAGTPVIIRRVVKMNNPGENSDNIYYAVEVNGIQETIPSDEMEMCIRDSSRVYRWVHTRLESFKLDI